MLSDLEGKGWQVVSPPRPDDEESVVARYRGEPIRAGFLTEVLRDTEDEIHRRYRTGMYDLELKLDMLSGTGQVKVERADGYEEQ